MLQVSVCSYSFHQMLKAGQMDIFQYIAWNDKHGFSQLEPWMAHLEPGYADDGFVQKVKDAATACGLKFGCLAVDGVHIYEPDAAARAANRERAKRWMDIAQMLGAQQVRIDAGGPEEPDAATFDVIVEGYGDVLDYARRRGLEVLVENHWGPTIYAANVVKLLEAAPGLALLLDSDNWAPGEAEIGARDCIRFARHTHIKRYLNQEQDTEAQRIGDLTLEALWAAGYRGPWGIESIALPGEEEVAVLETLRYLQTKIGALGTG
ncbi:MAG: TIM barrel protein [Litorilinea sp.]